MPSVLCIYRLAINVSKIIGGKFEKGAFGVHFLSLVNKTEQILLEHKFLKNIFVSFLNICACIVQWFKK